MIKIERQNQGDTFRCGMNLLTPPPVHRLRLNGRMNDVIMALSPAASFDASPPSSPSKDSQLRINNMQRPSIENVDRSTNTFEGLVGERDQDKNRVDRQMEIDFEDRHSSDDEDYQSSGKSNKQI